MDVLQKAPAHGWIEVIAGSFKPRLGDRYSADHIVSHSEMRIPSETVALDQDYLGRPFEPMPQLLAVAEFITKTRAICMVCGNPANHTQRPVVSADRVLVGAQGVYEARCRHCFDPALAGPPNP